MSMLLNLFKASKKLYQDFEDSRYGTTIPFVRSHKASKLNDTQVPDPKEDSAIKEFILKLAQDTEVENSTHLKNLVKILQLCINSTDTITLQISLTELREENRSLYGTLSSYSDYICSLDDFINRQIELEKHAKALAGLQQEIESRDAANSVLTLERDRLKEANKTAESKFESEMEDNLKLIAENLALKQDLQTSAKLNEQATGALRLELEAANRANDELLHKKMQYEITIAALRKEIANLEETIGGLEGTLSDKDNEHDKTKYELSVLSSRLDQASLAHLETNFKLQASERTVAKLETQMAALKREHQHKVTVLEETIKMHLATNEELGLEISGLSAALEEHSFNFKTELKQLKSSAAELEKQLANATDDNTTLKAQHETQLADAIAKAKASQQQFEASLAKAKNQAETLQMQLEELKSKNQNLQDQYKAVLDTNSKIQKDSAQKLRDAKGEKDLLETRLKNSSKESTTKIKELSNDLSELTEAKSQLQIKITMLEHELDKANSAIAAATKKSKELGQTVEKLRERLKQSETSRQQLAEANKVLQGSYDALRTDHQILAANDGAASSSDKRSVLHLTQTPQTLYGSRKSVGNSRHPQPQATSSSVRP